MQVFWTGEKLLYEAECLRCALSGAQVIFKKYENWKDSVEAFDMHCDSSLHIPKLPWFENMIEDSEKLARFEILNSTMFEPINVHIRRAYLHSSREKYLDVLENCE